MEGLRKHGRWLFYDRLPMRLKQVISREPAQCSMTGPLTGEGDVVIEEGMSYACYVPRVQYDWAAMISLRETFNSSTCSIITFSHFFIHHHVLRPINY